MEKPANLGAALQAENGFSIVFSAINNLGLSPYGLLEGAWIFMGILQGIRKRIWEIDPETASQSELVLFKLWMGLGLMTNVSPSEETIKVSFALTVTGENFVKMSELFEYEHSMMEQQLSGNFKTDPLKYRKLRKALAEYSFTYLRGIHDWINRRVRTTDTVMDFGGGFGQYLHSAMLKAVKGHGVLLDKDPDMSLTNSKNLVCDRVHIDRVDFRKEPNFYERYTNQFDVIIASEILHVMSLTDRKAALFWLSTMLKPGGQLFVVEQYHNIRLDWRLADMTKGGECLPYEYLLPEVEDSGYFKGTPETDPEGVILTATHWGTAFINTKDYDNA